MGIKKLKKENDILNMTLIDMLSKFDSTKTKKYTQFLVKMFIKKTTEVQKNRGFERPFRENDPLDNVIPYSSWENALIRDYITDWIFSHGDMTRFVEFTQLMEKGLIQENDISKYDSWEMLEINLFEAKNREMFKKSKKEIHRIFEDERYLVLKPLTYTSSCSYGYQTKWCTAMMTDPVYFYNHSRGILIYVIDKKENVKFAFYKNIPDYFELEHSEHENYIFKTFNQEDKQIDTIQTGLPQSILEIILRETNLNLPTTTPNYKLFSNTEKETMRLYVGRLPDETQPPNIEMTDQEMIIREETTPMMSVTRRIQPVEVPVNIETDIVDDILKDIQEHFIKNYEEPDQQP
jgi:hypothetical protein